MVGVIRGNSNNELRQTCWFYLDHTSATNLSLPEKSVHLETVAFRESRPVALPNPLHLAITLREIVSGLVHSASEGSCPRHQFSSFECSNRDHMLCLCWFGSRDYGTIGPLSSCYADSTAHVQFSEVQRNDRLTTVRPIVGKFEGIVFT